MSRLWSSTRAGGSRIGTRFRNTNVLLFVLMAIVLASVTAIVLQRTVKDVSRDYAQFYSAKTIGYLNTHLNREVGLLSKAVRSQAIIDWFADESNPEKRRAAYEEMMSFIEVLYSANLYFGIENSLNEYSVDGDYTYEQFQPFAVIHPEEFEDKWYFECAQSPNDYVFNVDIDKLLHRKRVWLNYKVRDSGGNTLGVLCSGLRFDQVVEELFSEYDADSVRGLVIDEHGVIQMDSAIQDESERLIMENDVRIDDAFADPAFQAHIRTHLERINEYFGSVVNLEVLELTEGPYSYVSIAPIESSNWSVVTFYNSSSLFSLWELWPLFVSLFVLFVVYTCAISIMNQHTLTW